MINKKISKILVPLDGSKNSMRALEMAISIARQFEATVTGAYSMNMQPHSEFHGITTINKKWDNEIKKMMADAKTLSAQNNKVFKEKLMRGDTGYNLDESAYARPSDRGLGAAGKGAGDFDGTCARPPKRNFRVGMN